MHLVKENFPIVSLHHVTIDHFPNGYVMAIYVYVEQVFANGTVIDEEDIVQRLCFSRHEVDKALQWLEEEKFIKVN